ncbi:tail fiber protein [Mucilaginibacter sp.]|uniref:phage tail protein n=1 Tax=Mucilaginibacter sp. TaxID=1882438 RepID=UPI00283D28BC|nr:tail fiber protein [Mucilaginibacter sp.]MDR3697522.1 tail fiber protein [Mucilaginibacter sp.]
MQNYLGEIRIFAGNFAPVGWFACNGQLLSISEYQALYALIGTTYGGNGTTTFGLPDLRGSIPISQGQGPALSNYVLGQTAGSANVSLTTQNIAHTHTAAATTNVGNTGTPGTGVILGSLGTTGAAYVPAGTGVTVAALNATVVQNTGGSLPHNNLMPTLGVTFIIAYTGIFPTQN